MLKRILQETATPMAGMDEWVRRDRVLGRGVKVDPHAHDKKDEGGCTTVTEVSQALRQAPAAARTRRSRS